MDRKILLFLVGVFFGCDDLVAQEQNFQDSARFYFGKGDINKAIFFGELELKRSRNLPEKNDTALLYSANDLALFYSNIGNYQLAEPLYKESLSIAEKVYGVNHYQYASILDNYGKLKKETGKYPEALSLIKKAISITKNKTGKEKEKNLIFSNNLGLVYLDIGDFYAAENQFLQIISERKKLSLDKGIDYTTTLNNLAVAYRNLANYTAAATFFKQAADLFIKNQGLEHPYTATTLNNLGLMQILLGNYVAADTLLKKSIDIKEKIFGKNNEQYALSLVSLAKNYCRMEKFSDAEIFLNKALEMRRNLLGEFHPNYAITLTELGLLNLTINRDSAAEAYLMKAILSTKNNFGLENPSYQSLSVNLATLYFFTKKYEKAISTYLANQLTERKMLLNSLDYLSGKELLAYFKSKEIYLSIPLSTLWHYNSYQFLKEAYNNRLLFNGIVLQNSSNFSRQLSNSPDSSLNKIWINYTSNTALLSKNISQAINKRNINCDSLADLINQQEKSLIRQSADYRNMKEKLKISWQDVKSNLKENEAAIEFVKFNNLKRKITAPDTVYYAAMLLRPKDTVPVFIKLFEEGELKAAIKSFAYKAPVQNRAIKTAANTNATKNVKSNIYNLVWQPLEPYLTNTKTIYFAPDGLLHQLAFAAIPNKNNTLLCDRYNLIQLTSTRQIAIKENENISPSSIALFGGINYNRQNTDTSITVSADPYAYVYQQNRSAGVDSFTYLPNTLKEIEGIKKSMQLKQKKISFYAGDKATEAAFRNIGGNTSPAVIHFATHGFTLPDTAAQKNNNTTFKVSDNPLLRSGLVLAGGNKGWMGKSNLDEDDGILTALEISSVPLQNTQLAVLSACETGTGELRGSEGVFGLQRAFKLAGVNYIMASLWQVPDKETGEFMNIFYSNWLGGKTIRQAFITTQQTMRKKYAPYYWAAFTLVQ